MGSNLSTTGTGDGNTTPIKYLVLNPITLFGAFILIVYGTIQTADFYGYDQSYYMKYIIFYAFILISSLVLPKWDPEL
jgi:hypothetical protein